MKINNVYVLNIKKKKITQKHHHQFVSAKISVLHFVPFEFVSHKKIRNDVFAWKIMKFNYIQKTCNGIKTASWNREIHEKETLFKHFANLLLFRIIVTLFLSFFCETAPTEYDSNRRYNQNRYTLIIRYRWSFPPFASWYVFFVMIRFCRRVQRVHSN